MGVLAAKVENSDGHIIGVIFNGPVSKSFFVATFLSNSNMEFYGQPAAGPPMAYPVGPPPAPPTRRGKKIIGVLILLFFILLIGGAIAAAVYFYLRPKLTPPPVSEECNSGALVLPTGTDTISCSAVAGYNVYPLATISEPTTLVTAFGPSAQYTTEEDTPVSMTGYYCSQECTATDGCVAAECVTGGDAEDMSSCTCTGYSTLPTALASDAFSTPCAENSQCSYVYIKSSALAPQN